ncbi:phage tail sheath protein, partial [Cellvibrio mixtus]|uniref:phage tail sheath protein n=1 Tax=Cellvibrio mixtus TaxID=39650 RepID=UPI00058691FD
MPDQYHHGVRVLEINQGTRTIRTPATAVIGLVATAPGAVADKFPLNTPVLITDIYAAIGNAGPTGTLKRALTAIAANAQPPVIVVRVEQADPEDEDASTEANIIGDVLPTGQKTGLKALLNSEQMFGLKPRLLGVPELDTENVAAELIIIAQKLRAFTYFSAFDCDTKEAAVLYRKKFGAREGMVIWPNFTSYDVTDKTTSEVSAVAYALGLRAKLDQTVGWHKTLSNIPVNGVNGISKPVFFDLQDPNTDAGYLNADEVTTLINRDGFRFWGSRTCSDEPLFAFENYTRTGQILADAIAEGHFWAVDKPMHPSLVRDIIESINAKFRELKNLGLIIDGVAWFDEDINT